MSRVLKIIIFSMTLVMAGDAAMAQVCASPSAGVFTYKTGNSITHNWTNVPFDHQTFGTPQVVAQMQTYDGPDTASMRTDHVYVYEIGIKIEEEQSLDSETDHTTEVVGIVATEDYFGTEIRNAADDLVGKSGGSISVNHNWETVNLPSGFSNPIIVAYIHSDRDLDPAHTRIRNVTSSSFQIRVEEWGYQDGIHSDEFITYFVIEAGVHLMRDGQIIMAGEVDVTQSTADVFTRINFPQSFPATPVVISHSQTFNGSDPMVTRMRNISTTGFDVLVEEEEAKDNTHATESIGYIAIYGNSDAVTGQEDPPVCTTMPAGQLGVLDLNANGGINPATGAPWQVGDQYRLAFMTSQGTQATSTDIDTYNAFVQGLADTAGLGSVDWRVIGSTATVGARDNTTTNANTYGAGIPIFAMDGATKIVDDYNDLWNGTVDAHITFDEYGNPKSGPVFGGSENSGAPRANGRVFGGSSESPPKVTIGNTDRDLNRWMVQFNSDAASSLPVYALSDPLTVNDSLLDDQDGDGVSDFHEFTFCEDETDADCSELSYQMHLASALILYEELPETTFNSYLGQVEQNQMTTHQACVDYVTAAHQQATNENLYPYALNDYVAEICPENIDVPNDRRGMKEQPALCYFDTGHHGPVSSWFAYGGDPNSRPRDLDPLLLMHAEKVLQTGSLSEQVCAVYNFLSKAGEILDDPRLSENYNPRFVSMLQELLMLDALTDSSSADYDVVRTQKVLLEAAFPEFMQEIQGGATFGLDLYSRLKTDLGYAAVYLSPSLSHAILNDQASEDREEAGRRKLSGGVDLSYARYYASMPRLPVRQATAAAVTAHRMKYVHYIVQAWKSGVFSKSILSAGAKIAKVSGGIFGSLLNALEQAIFNIKVSMMMGPDLGLLSGSEISILENDIDTYLRTMETTHNVTISGPTGDPLETGIYDSLSAPFRAVINEDNVAVGYLDFDNEVGGLPDFLAEPALQCDGAACWSDLIDLSDGLAKGLRDDCVSLVQSGSGLEYVQTQCDNEMRILCNEVRINSDGTSSVTDQFITAGPHPLSEADFACQGERLLASDEIALAASTDSVGILASSGLASLLGSEPEKDFGTGLVICEDNPSSNATAKAGYGYVSCAGGGGTVDVSGKSPASCEVPVDGAGSTGGSGGSGSDRCPDESSGGSGEPPMKKAKKTHDNHITSVSVFNGFFSEVLTKQKQQPELNFLNLYTLPVGQGSCHVLQCVVPKLDGSQPEIKNILYDCGSAKKIAPTGSTLGTFGGIVANFIDDAGYYLRGRMAKAALLGVPPELVVVSHTDQDHINIIPYMFRGDAPSMLPSNWILGGRIKDIPSTPGDSHFEVIQKRLLGGQPVTVNNTTIPGGTTAIRSSMSSHPEGYSETNISDALASCGATVDLLTVNEGIAPPSLPASTNGGPTSVQKNSVSAVLAVKVAGKLVAILPGDGLRETWTSANGNSPGLFTGIDASYPIRFLVSAHHGSFKHGSNDATVRDLVKPTHVVFSHSTRRTYKHVHSRAWQSFWRSDGASDFLADKDANFSPNIYMKESLEFGENIGDPSRPSSATSYIGPVIWNPGNTPNFNGPYFKNYRVEPVDIYGKALLSTHTNGLVLTTLATLKTGQTGTPQVFTIRRFNFDLTNFEVQFNQVMFQSTVD